VLFLMVFSLREKQKEKHFMLVSLFI